MRLVLEVTSFQRSLMGSAGRHVFDETGGIIGRARRCDWTLPDPDRFVSATHAEIAFDGGSFHVTDLSTNGLFVNGSEAPLGRGVCRPLQDGDRLALGDFEIVARLRETDPVLRSDDGPSVPDGPDAADRQIKEQEADDIEPDPIPPFPDPDVLNPPPRSPTATAPSTLAPTDPEPAASTPKPPGPTVPPPPPRWGRREKPSPLGPPSARRPVSADNPPPPQGRETSTLEAEYNEAIAGLDLKKLIGDAPAESEIERAPSERTPLPPPPPALGRRQSSEAPRDPPTVRFRPEPKPPSTDMPADIPARGVEGPIGDGSDRDAPLSPEIVEAGLRLPSHLPEAERKARLWDEFVRLYRARSSSPRGRS